MTSKLIKLGLALSISANTFALDMPDDVVDIRNTNMNGEVTSVISPSIFEIEVEKNGKDYHVFLELINIDFGPDARIDCGKNTEVRYNDPYYAHLNKARPFKFSTPNHSACIRSKRDLLGRDVKFEITSWTQPVLKGLLWVDGVNYNRNLVEKGVYRVDYTQTRSASWSLLEGRARCSRAGIWKSKMGDPIEDMKCRESF